MMRRGIVAEEDEREFKIQNSKFSPRKTECNQTCLNCRVQVLFILIRCEGGKDRFSGIK